MVWVLNSLDLKKQLIIPISNGVAVYDKNTEKVDFITGLNKMYPSTYGVVFQTDFTVNH